MSYGTKSDDSFGSDSRGDARLPELYPPRVLPKVLKKKPRYLETYRALDDRYPFSGFHIENEETIGHNQSVRYIHVVGKQRIHDELDLQVNAQYLHTVNKDPNTTTNPPITLSQLTGSALTSFPAELRRFFPKLVQSSEPLPSAERPIVRATKLGPFVPKTREEPRPGQSVITKKRTLVQTGAQQVIDYGMRAPRKYKVVIDQYAREKTSNKRVRIGKLRGSSNPDDDDDGDNTDKRGGAGDDDDGDDDAPSDDEFAYSDDDLESDGDYGVAYEDDDEDGNDMLAGGNDDEPVF